MIAKDTGVAKKISAAAATETETQTETEMEDGARTPHRPRRAAPASKDQAVPPTAITGGCSKRRGKRSSSSRK